MGWTDARRAPQTVPRGVLVPEAGPLQGSAPETRNITRILYSFFRLLADGGQAKNLSYVQVSDSEIGSPRFSHPVGVTTTISSIRIPPYFLL